MATNYDDIRDTMALLGEWEERYRFIIDLGRELPNLPDEAKTDANKVRGCASQVWLLPYWQPSPRGPLFAYQGDSDAHIVKGLVAIVLALYRGRKREEILALDAKKAFNELDLAQHLTAQRSNGLFSMIERIKADARDTLTV